ncbi:MAG: urea ABC transporter permease subunit UrtB [Hyphomicrobiales bacterium]|nr:urea ABC transporter permease subunit UrtB [Hyphomicrobiales bacterium]
MIRLLTVLAAIFLWSTAQAQTLDTALDRLAADSFAETESAINEIAASGAPNAQAILEAMVARRLSFSADKRIVYTDAAGQTFDARTGAAAEPLSGGAVVRLNNRLRGAIGAALGLLTLTSPDRQKRLDSAESIFKSKDAASLPALEIAIAKETDAKVALALKSARGAILLAKPDSSAAERLAAIEALSQRGDPDAMGQIRNALPSLKGEVRAAADAAIASIERRQMFIGGAQNIWYGLSLGSVLLLAAIGLAITFGVMGVINMAHGEMVMLGAYTTFMVQEVFRAYAPDYFGLSLPIAIPLAFLVAGLVGVAIERGIIRFLYGRPLETLLATWGVSLFLQQTVRTIFGPTNRDVASPSYMSGSFDLLGLQITYGRLWIIVFTLVVFALLLLILRRTPLGLQMRAVTQNRKMASSMGIRTPWVDAMTFGLGSGVAGIAGVALSQIDNVSPNLGQSYIIDSFMVVVFGGVGNLWGTLISAFSLGIANKLLEPLAGAVLAKIFILVLLILFIQKRPRGLFALKGRAVEA